MNEKDLISYVNALKLKGLEDVKCGDAMNVLLSNKIKKQPVIISALIIAKYSFLHRIKIIDNSGKAAFLFSNSYANREDHRNVFDKISSTSSHSVIFVPCKKISFKDFSFVFCVIQWVAQFQKVFNLRQSFYLASELYVAYKDAKYVLSEIKKRNISLLTVFCDFHLIDSIVVQLCNSNKIPTATLQHGHYSTGSVAFKYSHSTFFLGYGKYTYKIAKQSGFDMDRFLPLGMGQAIGAEFSKQVIHSAFGCFLVILDGNISEDVELLKLSKNFSEITKMQRIVKLHPGRGSVEDYSSCFLDDDVVVVNNISIPQLSERCDFALIAGGSTVFIEYLITLFPAFLYVKFVDRYIGFDWCKFETYEGLMKLYAHNLNHELDSWLIEGRDLVTEIDKVEKNYKEFFAKFQ